MLRGCCKDVASSSSRHAPPRGPLRGCCSRNPTVLHGRGDESAAGEPDHCQSATCARSTSDEPIWMAQVELISSKPRLEPREGSLHHVFHHQAPTGQPGHGIGPHRHVGRGSHAHGGPGGEAVGAIVDTDILVPQRLREGHRCHSVAADGTTPGTEWVSNVTRSSRRRTRSSRRRASFTASAAKDAYVFSRLGGYSATFPTNGFTTSVDIYLDMSVERVRRHRPSVRLGLGHQQRVPADTAATSSSTSAPTRPFPASSW